MNDEPPEVHRSAWHERTCARYLGGTSARSSPIAFLLVGQPGAGQAAIGRAAVETLGAHGGAVLIDADELTLLHPEFVGSEADPEQTASLEVIAEVEGVAAELIDHAVESRAHLVFVAWPAALDGLADLLDRLRSSGYRVVVLAPKVPPPQSLEALRERYERQSRRAGVGLWVHRSTHDAACEAAREALETIAARGLAEAIHEIGGAEGPRLARPILPAAIEPARKAGAGRRLKVGDFGISRGESAVPPLSMVPEPLAEPTPSDRARRIKVGSTEPEAGPVEPTAPRPEPPGPGMMEAQALDLERYAPEQRRAIERRMRLQEKLRRRARGDPSD